MDKFTKSRIKLSADIKRVIEYYGLEFKRVGSTYFTNCPFHNDKNPSLSIDTKKNCWHCWACDGEDLTKKDKHDHIGFVMKIEGLGFNKALERLAQIYGIVIPESGQLPREWKLPTPVDLPERPEPEPSYTDPAVMRSTMREYGSNPLYIFLSSLFDPGRVHQVFMLYNVGTAKKRLNPSQGLRSTVFWQVDNAGRVRGGKIVAYNEWTGKRLKRRDNDLWGQDVTWVHKLKDNGYGYNIKQCLFGAHLITEQTERVNVVESEKTALLASLYFGEKSGVWVATGGKSTSPLEKILEAVTSDSTRIVLYPDADAVASWAQLCADLQEIGLSAEISNIMDGQPEGSKDDIGDFIVSAVKGPGACAVQTSSATMPAGPQPDYDYTDPAKLHASYKRCEESTFFRYLSVLFDPGRVKLAFLRYNVGHDHNLEGSTVFWLVDELSRVRGGHIVSHDHAGRRVSNPSWCTREDGTCWHFELMLCAVEYNMRPCLFGAHLIRSASRVNIVAREETALMAYLMLGDTYGVWAATGTDNPEEAARLIGEAAHLIKGKDVNFYTEGAPAEDYMQLCGHLQNMGAAVNITRGAAEWEEELQRAQSNILGKLEDLARQTNQDEVPERNYMAIERVIKHVERLYQSGALYRYLITQYDPESVAAAFKRYYVASVCYGGTKKERDNFILMGGTQHTRFWYVDDQGRVRNAKDVIIDVRTGQRDPYSKYPWTNGEVWLSEVNGSSRKYKLDNCIFGQHLMTEAGRINIVASEIDAVTSSLRYGDTLGAWVATGTDDPEQCAVLISEAAHLIKGKELHFYTGTADNPDYAQIYARLQSMGVDVDVIAGALSDLPEPPQPTPG